MPSYNKTGGIISGGYATVPGGAAYGSYLDQYYPNWRDTVNAGGAYPVSIGDQITPGMPGYQGDQDYKSTLFGSGNPLNITGTDSYKRLMDLAKGPGSGYSSAAGYMKPATDYLTGTLANPAPLGEGRGDIVQQQALQAIDQAAVTANRQTDEAAAQMGSAYNPYATSFVKGQNNAARAASYGPGAILPAQEMDLLEKQMNEEFRAGLADTMGSLGLGLGGLAAQDESTQLGAASSAGQLESFALNTWAEILGSLLSGGSGIQGTVDSTQSYQFPTFVT